MVPFRVFRSKGAKWSVHTTDTLEALHNGPCSRLLFLVMNLATLAWKMPACVAISRVPGPQRPG